MEKQTPSAGQMSISDPAVAGHLAAARGGNREGFGKLAEPYRRELQVHCYRMVGSLQDAEDLVQETMLRAWQRLETFEGRASFRAWLYRIATNICLDALERRPRRFLPQTNSQAADPFTPFPPPIAEPIWLEPFPDELLPETETNPEARYAARESITLAFLTALQVLLPRQRAVLILRDVLDWHAGEVAKLLGLTLSAVNSSLYRARVTLSKHYRGTGWETFHASPSDQAMQALLGRYVHAWENADVEELVTLLKDDATFSMPPSPAWYQGSDSIRAIVAGMAFAGEARGRWHLLPTRANGQPAFAAYQREQEGGRYKPFAIQVLTFDGDAKQLREVITFLNLALFPRFNFPLELPA
jgi:RNA polymerase sigma-70 factor (ECF subfamily)